MSIESDTKFTKAMIDAMTLAEFEKLTPEQKIIIDIAQYAETEEYSKMWTAHNDGLKQGEHQAKVMMAKSLLEQSVSIETISIATGFTVDIIEQLKQEIESMIDSDTKFTKAIIDAMTLAEFEKLTPEQKIIIDIAQYAETEEYSKMWTAHNDGKREGLQEGIELGREEGKEEGEHQKETSKQLETC